jgi:hypothetical protein
MMARLCKRGCGVLLAALVLALPAPAAEVNRYLPEDTEILISINLKQILGSALVKQVGVEQIRQALNQIEEVQAVLKDLNFDPLKDLDQVLIASPGGNDQDKGLVIVHGTFDLDRFKKRGEDAAKDNPDILKVHKIAGMGGPFLLYEVNIPDQQIPLFVSLPNKNTLLVSPGKDYVVDALRKGPDKLKPELKSKAFQALLEKMDPKQSLAIAGLGEAFTKGGNLPDLIKDPLSKVDAIGGGITVDKGIDLEVVVSTRTVAEARELNNTINAGLTQGLGLLALLAANEKSLQPVVDILKTIRCTNKEKSVILRAQVSEDVLQKVLPPEK